MLTDIAARVCALWESDCERYSLQFTHEPRRLGIAILGERSPVTGQKSLQISKLNAVIERIMTGQKCIPNTLRAQLRRIVCNVILERVYASLQHVVILIPDIVYTLLVEDEG